MDRDATKMLVEQQSKIQAIRDKVTELEGVAAQEERTARQMVFGNDHGLGKSAGMTKVLNEIKKLL